MKSFNDRESIYVKWENCACGVISDLIKYTLTQSTTSTQTTKTPPLTHTHTHIQPRRLGGKTLKMAERKWDYRWLTFYSLYISALPIFSIINTYSLPTQEKYTLMISLDPLTKRQWKRKYWSLPNQNLSETRITKLKSTSSQIFTAD